MAEIVALDDIIQNIKRLIANKVTGTVKVVAQQTKKATIQMGAGVKGNIEVIWDVNGNVERVSTTEGTTVMVFDLTLPEILQ